MNELIRHIIDSFENNRKEFLIEIRRIFEENEYTINERTKVEVKGYFDDGLFCPFIQFDISTDEVRHSTVFYRYDYSRTNNVIKDEFDVLDNEEVVVTALTLLQEDIF